jgi:hypothetical protein
VSVAVPWGGVEWRDGKSGLTPFVCKSGAQADWAPQEGSQVEFLMCPTYEVLYEGTRGPGKTDALLMDFVQHVGPARTVDGVQQSGFGENWRGVLFRRTYPELRDVIDKSLVWFKRFVPGATYNHGEHYWTWPTGERLFFRHFSRESDYWSYHGHAYPWLGWEELTTWPDDHGYRKMQSTNRGTVRGMPRKLRSTTNPYGVGHNWVKLRWRLPLLDQQIAGPLIMDSRDQEGELEPPRRAIHGELSENKILLDADPTYISKLRAAARSPAELKAWLYGDWNIVAGGMFDDLWNPRVHVLPRFPFALIPESWRLDRSYDHGQSAPFSVGWWAESSGERFAYNGRAYGPIRGDLIRIAEWYGWNGRANEGVTMAARDIAIGIKERERDWGLRGATGSRVRPGPADTNIFDEYEPTRSVAGDMQREGVRWEPADKGPGSRKQGWEQIRKMLRAALPVEGGTRENPGLFVLDRCEQFTRTVPVLPRDVDKDPDDVDTEAEDHIGDETRYRTRRKRRDIAVGKYR